METQRLTHSSTTISSTKKKVSCSFTYVCISWCCCHTVSLGWWSFTIFAISIVFLTQLLRCGTKIPETGIILIFTMACTHWFTGYLFLLITFFWLFITTQSKKIESTNLSINATVQPFHCDRSQTSVGKQPPVYSWWILSRCMLCMGISMSKVSSPMAMLFFFCFVCKHSQTQAPNCCGELLLCKNSTRGTKRWCF